MPIGYTDNMIVLVHTAAELRERRNLGAPRSSPDYAMPSFDFADVPVRMTETEFEIDCEARTTPPPHGEGLSAKSAIRSATRSTARRASDIPAGDHMATMHRLACVGVGNNDITFSDLRSAVTGSLPLLQTAAAG